MNDRQPTQRVPSLFRICAVAGVSGALLTFVFGILHPKGTSDVGTLSEWMNRVHSSGVWVLVHFMLLMASILILVAAAGIARSYPEERAASWGRIGLLVTVIATAVAVITFLVDGAVVKDVADRWATNPNDPATLGAARIATDIGFILVAGLQVTIGMAALLFGVAGLAARSHPSWLAWLALAAGVIGFVSGSAHYLFGSSTWSVNAIYASNGLFGIWMLAMSRRLWVLAATPA